jgi:phosphatidylglycerophosphate synthase
MRRFARTLIAIAVCRAGIGLAIVVVFDPAHRVTSLICFGLFMIGLTSDQIDGWLARNYSTPNVAGYLQDAVSDKLLHVASLIALSRKFELLGIVVWLVVARDLTLLAIRVVSPNVQITLRRYRWQSLVYAGFLRVGLVGFFLIACYGDAGTTQHLTAFFYFLINSGALFGLVVLAHMTRQLTRDAAS